MLTLKQFAKSKNLRSPRTDLINSSKSTQIEATTDKAYDLINTNLTGTLISGQLSLKSNEIDEFSRKLAKTATSDEVLDELSSKVGIPADNESEDEFVKRASDILYKLLSKKMGL